MSKYKVTIERVKENNDATETIKDEKIQSESLKMVASVVGDFYFRNVEPSAQTEKAPNEEPYDSIIIEFEDGPVDEKSIDEQIKELIKANEADKPQEVQSEMATQLSRIVVQEFDKRMAEDAARHQA